MVLKGAATMVIRLSRAVLHRPFKPLVPSRIPELPPLAKTHQALSQKLPTRYYLFSSISRSFFSSINPYQQSLTNLMPFRAALNEIKRRLFFAAPTSSRLILSLLGYSLLPQSTFDPIQLNRTLDQIGELLGKNVNVDQLNEENLSSDRTSLDDYELGRLLGYGCNAAVYEARLRSTSTEDHSSVTIDHQDLDEESDIEILSRPSSNGSSLDDEISDQVQHQDTLNELTLREVRYRAATTMNSSSDILPDGQFNLAIKMLFNYGIQSNADALEKAMGKELLPLRKCSSHPNVIRMYSCFVDSFPLLKEAHIYYPMAIPSSLSSDGYGRNKTLFIVMRRYDVTLSEYIRLNKPSQHERLLLFTQLIEALLYLKRHSIAHRDLKGDNVLISNTTGELVLADFGCALHQPPNLKLPYVTEEIDKGGNAALRAPEIAECRPGSKSVLDYNKADLWASGTLFYEFCSLTNPFFHGQYRQDTYDDQQLPPLSPAAAPIVEQLIFAVLRKNPKERPSVSLVSDCLHLLLWFKSKASFQMNKNELYQSYMWTALETLFRKRSLSVVELNLKKLFFQRQCSQSLYNAQAFLHQLDAQI